MFTGSLSSVLFSVLVGFIFLQVFLFLYGVFKKKNGLIMFMMFTLFFSIVVLIVMGIWVIVEKSISEKERTAEEQVLYNQDVASSINVNDFSKEDWEMIMRAANGDYTAYYPILLKVFADDPETLSKVEDYGNALQVQGLITEMEEFSAHPLSYFLTYDGEIERELSKTAEHYSDVVSNIENVDMIQDKNYQALYEETNELITSLTAINGENVFTSLEQELRNLETLDLVAVKELYSKYEPLLNRSEELVLSNEEKITEHFNSITTDFEQDIKEALEVK